MKQVLFAVDDANIREGLAGEICVLVQECLVPNTSNDDRWANSWTAGALATAYRRLHTGGITEPHAFQTPPTWVPRGPLDRGCVLVSTSCSTCEAGPADVSSPLLFELHQLSPGAGGGSLHRKCSTQGKLLGGVQNCRAGRWNTWHNIPLVTIADRDSRGVVELGC
jgi:hypothetical protein